MNQLNKLLFLVLLIGSVVGIGYKKIFVARQTSQAACTALQGVTIAGAVVKAAELVAADGEKKLPEFCRLNAEITPQSINFEVCLPTEWNGKMHYTGGGGLNGLVYRVDDQGAQPVWNKALQQGYVDVNSDSGHTGKNGRTTDGSWALDNQSALLNFAYQAIPQVTAVTHEIIKKMYGRDATLSYFEGCSNGGKEALIMAQRYPFLFDGIIARAPAYNFTGLMLAFQRNAMAMAVAGAALSHDKIATVADAVLEACDELDGIQDNIVSNPQACRFNLDKLRCPGGTDTEKTCLSDPQLAALKIRASDATFAGGALKNSGWPFSGNENDARAWPLMLTGDPFYGPPTGRNYKETTAYALQDNVIRYMLARNAKQDSMKWNSEAHLGAVMNLAALLDATSPDLALFNERKGKMILWHGSNDQAISFTNTIRYYSAAVDAAGGHAAGEQFVRLYIAPGVNHCSGGPGADQADLLGALDTWVSTGTTPEELLAISTDNTKLSRPLCVYPHYPQYKGSGDVNAASSYHCVAP